MVYQIAQNFYRMNCAFNDLTESIESLWESKICLKNESFFNAQIQKNLKLEYNFNKWREELLLSKRLFSKQDCFPSLYKEKFNFCNFDRYLKVMI